MTKQNIQENFQQQLQTLFNVDIKSSNIEQRYIVLCKSCSSAIKIFA